MTACCCLALLLGLLVFLPGVGRAWVPSQKEDLPIVVTDEPQLDVKPGGLDFGVLSPGQNATVRMEITNAGKGVLRWQSQASPRRVGPAPTTRYISLSNKESRHTGAYKTKSLYQEVLELSGRWAEQDGLPVILPGGGLRFQFVGTGIVLHYVRDVGAGRYAVYVDQIFITEIDAQGETRERIRMLLADFLPRGLHTLTLVGKEGQGILDGFEILGIPDMKRPAHGTLTVLPRSGLTTREIDYVSIEVSTSRLEPGIYADTLVFTSNGGEAVIPVSFEVVAEESPKILDVFRYTAGNDSFLTSNPQADAEVIRLRRYTKEGIAFRLFPPGTPGTVEFYRWYNPVKKCHYYTYNRNDLQRMDRNYLLEGSIGNIATTRLRKTKELYRWFNPTSRYYFYTTDNRGEGAEKRGYRFDGIAGYVR